MSEKIEVEEAVTKEKKVPRGVIKELREEANRQKMQRLAESYAQSLDSGKVAPLFKDGMEELDEIMDDIEITED